jgi:peptidoglycan/xylan/chitin deacetylase (PgdA/CDA1 family)
MQPWDLLAEVVPTSLLSGLAPRDVTALFYHAFDHDPIPHISPLFRCKRPADFEQDLVFLKRHYHPVSHDDIVAHREGRRALPEKAVAVSFDDGFAECFSWARPLLLRYGIPATFFVCESFVDNHALMHRNKVALCLSRLEAASAEERRGLAAAAGSRLGLATLGSPTRLSTWLRRLRFADLDAIDATCDSLGIDVSRFLRERRPYMSGDQLARLNADGFTLGAHTTDHPELGSLQTWGAVRRQVRDSCNAVRVITGRDRVPFAFPFNGLDLGRQSLAALREELGGIDLMYDTNNLMKDRAFIVNRIWCDTPQGASADRSNLPMLIRRAHALEPARAVKRRLRGLPR